MSDRVIVERKTSRRGLASMTPEKRREIARMGGKAGHLRGTAYEWDSEAARAAGRKGGLVSRGGRGKLRDPFAPPARAEGEGSS